LQTKELAKTFGRNIKAARVIRGYNQEKLCELANMDRSYLSRVENGNCKITLDKVYSIALALNCSLAEILPELVDEKSE